MKTSWIALVMFTVGLALVAGCATQQDQAADNGSSSGVGLSALQLKLSSGCDDLKDYLEASWLERVISPPVIYLRDGGGGPVLLAGAPATDAAAAQTVPDDVSQTNTQEPGVDEADLVKADRDGNLYAVSDGFLVIERGFPPEDLHEISRLDLGASGQGLYLDEANHRLVVIAASWTRNPVPVALRQGSPSIVAPTVPEVSLIFIDVSDPAAPSITRRLSVEGYTVASRRIGDRVHLAIRFWIPLPAVLETDPLVQDLAAQYEAAVRDGRTDDAARLKQAVREAIHAAVKSLDMTSVLPRAEERIGSSDARVGLLSCANVYRPGVQLDAGLLVVASADTDGTNASAVGIMNNAWLTYASAEHLYVSQSSGGWWWNGPQDQRTAIYKFAMSSGRPQYRATGSIAGWVKDQFSFSEYQGHLRVALTEDRVNEITGQWQPVNHLFVLTDTGAGTLSEEGSVRDLAPGERIFAARFLDDRGFVVTFRRVDPLFAFDLSDPAHPVVKGETEIPGVSTYLHPIDRDHLLTVGRDGGNVQLQIFDVSDLAHPVRTQQYVPPGATFSYSGAEYDHLAFTYYAPRNLLVIPLVTGNAGSYFSGMAAYRVSVTGGFTELGLVDHADLAKEAYCSEIQPDESWRSDACANGWYLWGAAPRRSIIMTGGDATYLYSVSDIGIKATAVDAPSTILGRVLFPNAGPFWWGWFGILSAMSDAVGAGASGMG